VNATKEVGVPFFQKDRLNTEKGRLGVGRDRTGVGDMAKVESYEKGGCKCFVVSWQVVSIGA